MKAGQFPRLILLMNNITSDVSGRRSNIKADKYQIASMKETKYWKLKKNFVKSLWSKEKKSKIYL